jgi:PAS domain S-box-containing protein
MYGYEEKGDIIGRSPLDFAPPFQPDGENSKEKAIRFITAALSGVPQKFYWRSKRKGGTLFDVEVSLNRLNLKEKTYVQAIVRDITERKALERQRESLLEILRHDMKTPLNVITGNAEMILSVGRGNLSQDLITMLGFIHAGAKKLNKMLDDQLIIFNIESCGAIKDREKTDITELLAEASFGISELARSKGLSFDLQISDGLPKARIDRLHVLSAVTNLLQNAVNYTPTGSSIKLSAGTCASAVENCVLICVSDEGIGIPADEQAKVFEKYYRSKTAKGVKGCGLGLAIVKAVAEEHGGRVELESEVGKGSTFKLILPVDSRTSDDPPL